MLDFPCVRVSAGVALTGDSVLRCQVQSSDSVEFFWEHDGHDFDMAFTLGALREMIRQGVAALEAAELFDRLDDRNEQHGEFSIVQGENGRVGTVQEFRRRLGLPTGPNGGATGV